MKKESSGIKFSNRVKEGDVMPFRHRLPLLTGVELDEAAEGASPTGDAHPPLPLPLE